MRRFSCWRIFTSKTDVLIAWPPSGALPEGVREEKFSADE
jgi:hypothetical protein